MWTAVTAAQSWWRSLICFFLAAAMTGGAMFTLTVNVEVKAVQWRTPAVAAEEESGEPRNLNDLMNP